MGRATAHQKVRVLIVDGNEVAADMAASMLNLLGFDASSSRSGAVGIVLCRAWRPAIVFVDLALKCQDGLETARRLRQLAGPGSLRIVALGGGAGGDADRLCFEAGCDARLEKPATLEELLVQIKTARARVLGQENRFLIGAASSPQDTVWRKTSQPRRS